MGPMVLFNSERITKLPAAVLSAIISSALAPGKFQPRSEQSESDNYAGISLSLYQ